MEECVNDELDDENRNNLIGENETKLQDEDGDDTEDNEKQGDETTDTESSTGE